MVEFNELDELYQDIILDHYRNPRNRRRLESPDIAAHGLNPFCGDEVYLDLKLNDGHIAEVGFSGQGCSISQASVSIMTGLLKGKTLDEARELHQRFKRLMRGEELPEEEQEELGSLEALEGVRRYPIRIKCAMLGWATLDDGIEEYEKGET